MEDSCRFVSTSICWVSKFKTHVDETWYQGYTVNKSLKCHGHIFPCRGAGTVKSVQRKTTRRTIPVFQSGWRNETFSSPKPPRLGEGLTRSAGQWVLGFFPNGTAVEACSWPLITYYCRLKMIGIAPLISLLSLKTSFSGKEQSCSSLLWIRNKTTKVPE